MHAACSLLKGGAGGAWRFRQTRTPTEMQPAVSRETPGAPHPLTLSLRGPPPTAPTASDTPSSQQPPEENRDNLSGLAGVMFRSILDP